MAVGISSNNLLLDCVLCLIHDFWVSMDLIGKQNTSVRITVETLQRGDTAEVGNQSSRWSCASSRAVLLAEQTLFCCQIITKPQGQSVMGQTEAINCYPKHKPQNQQQNGKPNTSKRSVFLFNDNKMLAQVLNTSVISSAFPILQHGANTTSGFS